MILQGAGAFGSSEGSAGFDPVADPSPSNVSTAPVALLFDPSTRDFRLNGDGRFASVDPIDQAVVFALFLKQGSIGSAPNAGSQIRSLQRQGGPGFVGKVQDIVRNALKQFTDAGQIRIVDVRISTPVRGRTYITVSYVNLTLAASNQTTLPLSI